MLEWEFGLINRDVGQSVDVRSRAPRLARNGEWQAAMQLAASAELPWYRSQAFAGIALEMGTDVRWREAVKAAVECCLSAEDAYVSVGAAAWPISVLIRHGELDQAGGIVNATLRRVVEIEHQGSMAGAIRLLWMGAYPLGQEMRERVAAPLVAAATQDQAHWRIRACLRNIVEMIGHEDREAARQFVESLPPGKIRHGVMLAFDRGRTYPPLSF